MITPSLVKAQVLQFLPVYTDLFADAINGSAAYSLAGNLITINSVGHGLETGDVIPVHQADVINPITGVSFASGIATLTTTFNHDRTNTTKDAYYKTNKAELEGFADSNYNGEFDVQLLPSRTQINITEDADVIGALGDLVEAQFTLITSYSVTKVDDDNFTVVSPRVYPDGTAFKNFKYIKSARVHLAANASRALSAYTKIDSDKAVIFILFGPETVSKDRNSLSDAITSATSQNPVRLTYLPEVSFLVFLNTSDDLTGAKAMQTIYEEVKPALRRTMFAHGFNKEDVDIQFRAVESDNLQEFYDTAAYVHRFSYQIPYQITQGQGFVFRPNVAFDDILVNATMFDTDGALIQATISLER